MVRVGPDITSDQALVNLANLIKSGHPLATAMATDRSELAEQIDACILMLARLAVEVQRGTADESAGKTIGKVTQALERYRAEHTIPERDVRTDALVMAVADVYTGIRQEKSTPDDAEYDRRLRAALEPFDPRAGELEDLALSLKEIVEKEGPIEAAKAALADHLDEILARRGGRLRPLVNDKAGRVHASTLRNRQKAAKGRGELGPVVTSADARAYLAELARGIEGEVERARRSIK